MVKPEEDEHQESQGRSVHRNNPEPGPAPRAHALPEVAQTRPRRQAVDEPQREFQRCADSQPRGPDDHRSSSSRLQSFESHRGILTFSRKAAMSPARTASNATKPTSNPGDARPADRAASHRREKTYR